MTNVRPTLLDAQESEDKRYVHYAPAQAGELNLIQYGWFKRMMARDQGMGPAVRPYFLIHFIKAGAGRVVIGDTEYHVQAGQMFAFYPNQITYYESDEADPWEYYWIGFDGTQAEAMMREAELTPPQCLVRPIPQAQQVFAALESGRQVAMDTNAYLLLLGQLYICLHYLIEGAWDVDADSEIRSRKCPDTLSNEYVRMVTEFIAHHYAQPITVAEIAERMGLNRNYLTAVFRRHTGRSIKDYLVYYRIERVKVQLQYTRNSIKQAAMSCGFLDPLYFSRLFKERVGVSPQEYRRQCAQDVRQEETEETQAQTPQNDTTT